MAGKPQDHDPNARADDGLAPATLGADAMAVLAFFTRLPLPLPDAALERPLAKAAWAFPVAGLAVGAVVGVVLAVALGLDVPALAAALLALAAGALVTGGLHEDGLADLCDGLGGDSPEHRLAIMRDSRIGSFGVIGLVVVLGAKAAALAALAGVGAWTAVLALIAAHAAGRAALPAAMHWMTPAGRSGLAVGAGTPTRERAGAAAAIGTVFAVVALGLWAGLAAAIVGGLAAAGVAALARRRLGGYNGDALGAMEQAVELAVLLTAAAALAPS